MKVKVKLTLGGRIYFTLYELAHLVSNSCSECYKSVNKLPNGVWIPEHVELVTTELQIDVFCYDCLCIQFGVIRAAKLYSELMKGKNENTRHMLIKHK